MGYQWQRVSGTKSIERCDGDKTYRRDPCGKCNGTGVYGRFGACFSCNGSGYGKELRTDPKGVMAREKAKARRVAKQQEQRRERQAYWDAKNIEEREQVEAAYPEVFGVLAIYKARGMIDEKFQTSFLYRVAERFAETNRLNMGQAESVMKAHEKQQSSDQRFMKAESVPAGRLELTGTVVGTKWADTPYGEILKMTFEDDRGFKVFGSVPSSLDEKVERGTRLKFTATLEQSRNERRFGFFKRPTKASIIDQHDNAGVPA